MNQMNNNDEKFLDVDELYNIAKRLKDSKMERVGLKAILKKNPGPTIRERYAKAKLDYIEALTDFDVFITKYIKTNPLISENPLVLTSEEVSDIIKSILEKRIKKGEN